MKVELLSKKFKSLAMFLFFVMAGTGAFAADKFAEAKAFESKGRYCYALGKYYDLICSDIPEQEKLNAIESYRKLKSTIESGNPGFGNFSEDVNEEKLKNEWIKLLIDAEKYCSENGIFDVVISDSVKEAEQKSLSIYSCQIKLVESRRFSNTASIIYKGLKNSKLNLDDINLDSVSYSTSSFNRANVPGNKIDGVALLMSNDSVGGFNFVSAKNAFANKECYEVKLNVVDENGKVLVQPKVKNGEGEVEFTKIPTAILSKIIDGKAKANFVSLNLCYGDENSIQNANQNSNKKSILKSTIARSSYLVGKDEISKKVDQFAKPIVSVFLENKFVDIPNAAFDMFKTEVPQELYELVMGENPSENKGSNHPVERVSWFDSLYFCNKLSVLCGLTPVYYVDGTADVLKWDYIPHIQDSTCELITVDVSATGFKLPTKEEFEYAAKGGQKFNYSGSNDLDEVAWYDSNSDGVSHPVAQKKPNGYGLYDMDGNVLEWLWNSTEDINLYCNGTCTKSDMTFDYSSAITPDCQSVSIGLRIIRLNKTKLAELNSKSLKDEAEYNTKWVFYLKKNFVKIPTKNYKMLNTEVTQELYEFIMKSNPSKNVGKDLPVTNVSLFDAIYFCNKLSERAGLTPAYLVNGKSNPDEWNYVPHSKEKIHFSKIYLKNDANGYRLPLLDEWIFAAKGGQNYIYSGSSNFRDVAWYDGNSDGVLHPVAQKKANDYGLFDMSGNVCEWVFDFEHFEYHYICGGDYFSDEDNLEIEKYISCAPDQSDATIGFRVICFGE